MTFPTPSGLWLALVWTRSNVLVKMIRDGFQASWFFSDEELSVSIWGGKRRILAVRINWELQGLPLVLVLSNGH